MLGWESPDAIAGGLGVAAAALAEALGEQVPLDYWFAGAASSAARSYRSGSLPVELPAYAGAPGADWYGPALQAALEQYTRMVMSRGGTASPSLIHAHDWMTFPAAGHLARQHEVPLVYHVHSTAFDREGESADSVAAQTEQRWLPEADLVLTVSDYSARQLIERFDLEPERVQVLRHGRPAVDAYRKQKPFPEKLVLFAGRMTWQKGPQHFLTMALQLHQQRKDLRFLMLGEGDEWPAILKRIGAARAGLRIQAPGKLPQSELFDLYSMADLLVMTSASEPFGLVALEAAHFGVPVILPPNCGAVELLPQNPVIDPQNTDALVDKSLELLDHPNKHKKLLRRQRSALHGVDWEASAQQLLTHYAHLLGE